MRNTKLSSEFKVYHASVVNDLIFLEKKRPRAYRLDENDELKLIASGWYTLIHLFDGSRIRLYELYLKTFFGEFDAPHCEENDLPEYDLINAKFKYTKDVIWINDQEFRVIPHYFGYFVSNKGAVYSILRNQIMKHRLDKDGYHKVDIHPREYGEYRSKASSPDIRLIHHLVYMAWVDPTFPRFGVVHHKDNIKWHNYPSNIERTTARENTKYAIEDGLLWQRDGLSKDGFTWNDNVVHLICKMMSDKRSIPEIANVLHIEDDTQSYAKLCYKIQEIKRSFTKPYLLRLYKDIINQYPEAANYTWKREEFINLQKYRENVLAKSNQFGFTSGVPKNIEDRLTPEEIRNILFENSMGVSAAELARRHNISPASAVRLVRRYQVNPNSTSSTTIERVSDQ